jgi:hypothetical protein
VVALKPNSQDLPLLASRSDIAHLHALEESLTRERTARKEIRRPESGHRGLAATRSSGRSSRGKRVQSGQPTASYSAPSPRAVELPSPSPGSGGPPIRNPFAAFRGRGCLGSV